MSEALSPAAAVTPIKPQTLQLVRLPVDKPGPAVQFLRARSRGVMDLIAHFWERLAHTPPLQRPDLHLVAATSEDISVYQNINTFTFNPDAYSGAMLYVPKAHRADVLALEANTAASFAAYIAHYGGKAGESGPAGLTSTTFSVTDFSISRPVQEFVTLADGSAPRSAAASKAAIDFLTGDAQGIAWMTPLLLPLVQRRSPAKQLVNVVMQLPPEIPTQPDTHVRLARDADIPLLNRWRRNYKEERGILFDADMDAWVQQQRVFVLETAVDSAAKDGSAAPGITPVASEKGGDAAPEALTAVVAIAKFDLDLQDLVEIGGVYTFPEYRNHGYGASLVRHLAWQIRQQGKTPTLQVDEQNDIALRLYQSAGWKEMGRLARVWLTG